jgi:hypothetical protein
MAQRIGRLFNRRPSTHWSSPEVKQYKRLVKDGWLTTDQDIELIERYYACQREKGDAGIHRRDLKTFLNNFPGEMDRAHAWKERSRPKKKFVAFPQKKEPRTSDEECKKIGEHAREQLDAFRKSYGNRNP